MTLDVVRLSAIVGIGSGAVVGRRLGPYRLLEKGATGAHAAVYRARHELMGVERAVKVPRPGAAWPEQGERFLSEARVAARLRHPNVDSVHDCGRAPDGTPYIVMELVPGRTLAQRLADGVPSAAETLRVAEQVARALDHGRRPRAPSTRTCRPRWMPCSPAVSPPTRPGARPAPATWWRAWRGPSGRATAGRRGSTARPVPAPAAAPPLAGGRSPARTGRRR